MTITRKTPPSTSGTENTADTMAIINRILLTQPVVPQYTVSAGVQKPKQPDPAAFRQLKPPAGRHLYTPPDVIERPIKFDFFKSAYISGAATIQTTREFALIPEGIFRSTERICSALTHGHNALLQLVTDQAPVQRVPGLALVISSPWNNYWHWLIEHLPKITLLMHLDKMLFKECSFILEPQFPLWKREVLQIFGVSPHQIIESPGGTVSLRPDYLIVPTYPQPNAAIMSEISQRLLAVGKAPQFDMGSGLIYIQRGAAWGKRRLLGEADFAAKLSTFGFQVIQADHYTPIEQAHIFSKAKVIVGIHGSALTNIFHAPESATIIELFGARVGLAFRQLAYEMLQDHVGFFGNISSPCQYINGNPSESDVIVNTTELLDMMRQKFNLSTFVSRSKHMAMYSTRQTYFENAGEFIQTPVRQVTESSSINKTLHFQILNLPNQQFEKTRYLYSVSSNKQGLQQIGANETRDYETYVKQCIEQGFCKVQYRQKKVNRALIDAFNGIEQIRIAGIPFPEFLSYDRISMWQFIMPAVYNGPCKEVFEIIEYLSDLIKEHQPETVVISGNLLDYQENTVREILGRHGLPGLFNKIDFPPQNNAAGIQEPTINELHAQIESGNRTAIGAYSAHLQKQFLQYSGRKKLLMVSYPSAWRTTASGEIDRYYDAFGVEMEKNGFEGIRLEVPYYFLINGSKKSYIDSVVQYKRGGFNNIFFDAYAEGAFEKSAELFSIFSDKFEQIIKNTDFRVAFSWKGYSFLDPLLSYWRNLFTTHISNDAIPALFIARNLLAELSPEALFVVYEAGVYSRALTIQAFRAGIPSFALQHAEISDQFKIYTDENISYSPNQNGAFLGSTVPLFTLVWGEFHRKLLTNFGSYQADSVKCVGNWMATDRESIVASATPENLSKLRSSWTRSDKKVALLLTAVSAIGAMEEIASKLDKTEFSVLVKPHPQEKNGHYYYQYLLDRGFEVTIIDGYLYEAILVADIIIADIFSTTCCESLLFEKTVYGYQDREPSWTPSWRHVIYDLHREEKLVQKELSEEAKRNISIFLEEHGMTVKKEIATRKVIEHLLMNLPGNNQLEFNVLKRINLNRPLKLYAGDVPEMAEYTGWIGLSLTQHNDRHIQHDITCPLPFPENSVDAFQAEDVIEHIQYDMLVPVINEIYRVLKPGALFRLSVPDYGCDVLRDRSLKDAEGNIIFDPGGGGTLWNPGHVWFPDIEKVYRLLEKTNFYSHGTMDFLHYWNVRRPDFVVRQIDYSKGIVRGTPDFDDRVKSPYRPMSIVVDLYKK